MNRVELNQDNRPILDMAYMESVFMATFPTVEIMKDVKKSKEFLAFLLSMELQFPNYKELARGLKYIYNQLTLGDSISGSKVKNRPEEFFGGPDGLLRAYNMLMSVKENILAIPNPVMDAYPALIQGRTKEEAKLFIFQALWGLIQITLSYFKKMGIENKSVIEALAATGNDVTNLVEFKKR